VRAGDAESLALPSLQEFLPVSRPRPGAEVAAVGVIIAAATDACDFTRRSRNLRSNWDVGEACAA